MKGIGRGIGVVCFIAVAVCVSYVTYNYFALSLLFNGTTRHLYQYREMVGRNNEVDLIPGLFRGGESKADVKAQLLGSGLEEWHTSYTTMPSGAASVERFHLWAGGRNVSCGSELFMLVGYDARDLLVTATLSQGGACL